MAACMVDAGFSFFALMFFGLQRALQSLGRLQPASCGGLMNINAVGRLEWYANLAVGGRHGRRTKDPASVVPQPPPPRRVLFGAGRGMPDIAGLSYFRLIVRRVSRVKRVSRSENSRS